MKKKERAAGVLLHISSLPGKQGCGTLGEEARVFARWLSSAGMSYWQILPLHPVCSHFGFSPYASTSTFAGNEMLISLPELRKKDLLPADYEKDYASFKDSDFVNWESLERMKKPLLRYAADRFFTKADAVDQAGFAAFRDREKHWLEDYTLFSALADHFGGNDWTVWKKEIAARKPDAVGFWRRKLAGEIRVHEFTQFIFFSQWRSLKEYCHTLGIGLIGDMPMYVNLESADAWACPEIFQLGRVNQRPLAVAGVPPDYFSAVGQRWGNPLYRWFESNRLCPKTVSWWVGRLGHALSQCDLLRLDHFRAFASYYTIPAAAKTAVNGKWLPGPGKEFFQHLAKELGDLPFIAEDLGYITPDVESLRRELALPGMKILQFAFSENSAHPYLPHNYADPDWVVYTGTHDNDTSNGWFYGLARNDPARNFVIEYCGAPDEHEFHWRFIRLALASTAWLAIIPMQDVLGFGSELRMNTPGTVSGNWRWRLTGGRLQKPEADRLRSLCRVYGRLPAAENPGY